jgi:SAM-dependent methyltransferase
MTDATDRFSNRADAYARARPSYPKETLAILRAHHGLKPGSVVADIGSGTGIFTRLLLESGAKVFAVEPNADMRAEAERTLGADPRFVSIDGRAEATALEAASVDLIVAAQAFHWFEVAAARIEHARILRPGAHSALIWNDRDLASNAFLREYERILTEYCPGYPVLQGKADTPEKFDAYFGKGRWTKHTSPNAQSLDRELLVVRVMSSSYAPSAESDGHAALVQALEACFDRYAENGADVIPYLTTVIGGALSAACSAS